MAGSDEGNWASGINGICALLIGLVILVTILRVYTRVWIANSFWWDDVTILLAVVRLLVIYCLCLQKTDLRVVQLGTTIGAALCFVEVGYGFGKHYQFLNAHQRREFQKYTYGEWIQTFFTLMWTKVSICLFLMRIPHSKAFLLPLQWAVAFLLFSNTVLSVMWIMQCQPIRLAWDETARGGCLNKDAKEGIILTQAVISIVSDFIFAVVPVLLLWRIQIDLKTKVGLCLLMGLGLITGACCLVRTVINKQALPLDESYDGIVNWVWRTFEVQIGIIAACIPTLRPLYLRIMGKKHGGDDTLGSNVKYPLSGAHQSWVENTRKSRGWSRNSAREPEEATSNGGIEKYKDDVPISPLPRPAHKTGNGSLNEDMARYGIEEAV